MPKPIRHRWIEPLLGPWRVPFLVGVGAVTVVLGVLASGLRLDAGNKAMNATDPERAALDHEFERTFGTDDVLLLGLTHPGLLGPQGLALLDELTKSAEAIDGVARAESLTNARRLVAGPFGAERVPIVPRPLDDPDTEERTRRALDNDPLLAKLLISPDLGTAVVAVEIEQRPGDPELPDRIIRDLRALAATHSRPGVEVHLTGVAVQKHDAARAVGRDVRLLLPVSAAVLAALLAVVFRRRSGVIVPLAVTAVAVIWTLGLYALAGFSINIITSLLPLAVLALSLATSLHLYDGWLTAGSAATDSFARTRATVERLLVPCLLTGGTTAIGLGSLAVSDVPAVRQFGSFAALGVLLATALNLTLLPALLVRRRVPRENRPVGGTRGPILRAIARISVHRPRAVVIVALVLAAAAIPGIARLRNDTDLVRFLRDGTPLVRDTRALGERLGGINALDAMVWRRDGAPLATLEDLRRLDRFLREIRRIDGVAVAVGLPDLVGRLYAAETGRDRPALPSTEREWQSIRDLLEAGETDRDVRRVVTPRLDRTRLHVRVRALGTARAAEVVGAVDAAATRTLGSGYEWAQTGGFHDMAVDSNRIVRSQIASFGLALVLVLATLAFLLRSVRRLLAAAVPNVVPIVWTGGVMGYAGIELSTATAMVAAVVIGIAVDGTIHYLSRFAREDRGDAGEAVMRTTEATGRVLVAASAVLVAGFWVGAFGSFRPTIYFSLLTGATILGALVCDLFVLPACLVLMERRHRSRRLGGLALLATSLTLLGPAVVPARAGGSVPLRIPGTGETVILHRTWVPSAERPQAEVRLARRGEQVLVQTVIFSKVPRRVLGAIAEKEAANWPEGRPGHEDAEAYVEALRRLARGEEVSRPRVEGEGPAGDRLRRLLIEFAMSAEEATVRLAAPEVERRDTGLEVTGDRTVDLLRPARAYVVGNARLIVIDSFGEDSEAVRDLERLLARWPPGSPPDPAPGTS